MQHTVLPFQVSKGAKVVACFVSEDDPNKFVWIRRFNNNDDKKALHNAVYNDQKWLNDIRPSFGDLLQEKDIRTVRAVDFSPIQ